MSSELGGVYQQYELKKAAIANKIAKKTAEDYAKAIAKRAARETREAAKAKKAATMQERSKCPHTCTKYMCQNCTKRCIIHMKPFGSCKICEGWGYKFCSHGSFKQKCIICSPKYFCIHKKRIHRCTLCPLYKKESYPNMCVECAAKTVSKKWGMCATCRDTQYKDTNIVSKPCVHDKYKPQCSVCSPMSFCEHGSLKERCKQCPFFKPRRYSNMCAGCQGKTVTKKGMLCATCRKAAQPTVGDGDKNN